MIHARSTQPLSSVHDVHLFSTDMCWWALSVPPKISKKIFPQFRLLTTLLALHGQLTPSRLRGSGLQRLP